jgi:hypothetical protein
MNELERSLRSQMGDRNFEACYRSAFGRLRADRKAGDFPSHQVVMLLVQSMLRMEQSGYDENTPMFDPFGSQGVHTPEPDSVRIIQGSKSPSSSNSTTSSGGCYIATAVYGSYNCPQVWTLRRYRDNTLFKTWYGRSFIRIYYAISPTLVLWFGETKWFQRLWKNRLDNFVRHLQKNGVDDMPYVDKF